MTKDKKVLYSSCLLIFAVLLTAFFINITSIKIITACLLLIMAVAISLVIKKRTSYSVSKREVLLLSAIIGVFYVIFIHMSGLLFGYYHNPYFITQETLLTTVLPFAVSIVASEMIRATLLAQKNLFSSIFAFLICVMAEILIFSNLEGITNFNRFMDLFGMTFIPSMGANFYYNFAAGRFGALPNIAFRLITTLYIYFIPTKTAMSDALLSCIKVFVPFILFALVSALFEKKKKFVTNKKKNRLSTVVSILSVAATICIVMLVSCQFRFGAVVIASESMTGEINKGDVIIYEKYDGQPIKEGQVIFFNRFDVRTIHRVVKIEHVGNETRYYTKGDANETIDSGFATKADIIGLTDVKVSFIGYPTLWLRELLEGSN